VSPGSIGRILRPLLNSSKKSTRSADNCLFVITPDSVVSEACQNEVAHAAKNNKRLVPLLRHSVPDAEIPKELAKINFVYFAEFDPFDATFKSLLDTLDADLDWIGSNMRLLVRVKEWEQKNKNKSFLLTGEDPRNGKIAGGCRNEGTESDYSARAIYSGEPASAPIALVPKGTQACCNRPGT
jgi:TIR domain